MIGHECREWAPRAVHAEVEFIIVDISQAGDAVIFTDGSVVLGSKSE